MKITFCDKCTQAIAGEVKNLVIDSGERVYTLDLHPTCYSSIVTTLESISMPIVAVSRKNYLTKEKKEKLNSMLDEGKLSNPEIASELGLTVEYISKYKSRYLKTNKKESTKNKKEQKVIKSSEGKPKGVATKPNMQVKENTREIPKSRKLDVGKIKALLAAGWSYEKIARSEYYCSVEEVKDAIESSDGKR